MSEITPQDKLNELKTVFSSAQKILILIRKEPTFDLLAAGLSLYLAIKKAGKDVEIFCETPVIVENANLVGVDKIKNKIGNKNLVVSFDYVEGAIEKVSYNITDDKFNLVIQPKNGFLPLSSEKINYSYSGLNGDLVITIGCQSLADLGSLVQAEKDFFDKVKTINIDIHQNSNFAKFNVNTPGVLSCSELAVSLFQPLGLQIETDISTNLLAGMEYASASFSDPRLDATTFETIAFLLRQGAKRQKVPGLKVTQEIKQPVLEEKRKPKAPEAPVDWLQPKIYKSGQLL